MVDDKYFVEVDFSALSRLESVKIFKPVAEKYIRGNEPSNKGDILDKRALYLRTSRLGKQNIANFYNGLRLTLTCYVPFMTMIKRGETPCNECFQNFEYVMFNRWNFEFSKNSEKFLMNEAAAIKKLEESLEENLYCKSCSSISQMNGYYNDKAVHKKQSDFKSKIADLLAFINKEKSFHLSQLKYKIQLERSGIIFQMSFYGFSIDSFVKYLDFHLIELEHRLLADNIFAIESVDKPLIKLFLIRPKISIKISNQILEKLNGFRENSLFHVQKAGFKSYPGFYSNLVI